MSLGQELVKMRQLYSDPGSRTIPFWDEMTQLEREIWETVALQIRRDLVEKVAELRAENARLKEVLQAKVRGVTAGVPVS